MDQQRLLQFLRDRCYREGDFTLASGAKSTYYFDGKMAFMSSEGASLIGEAIYQATKDLEFNAIGGLEIGAVPITTAAVYAYQQHGEPKEGFFVRNQPKSHGTKKIIEGKLSSGNKVVIVDDVATKGGSIMKAVEAVRKAECTPVAIVVLVDRQEGASELFAKQGIPFHPLFTIADFQSQSLHTAGSSH